MYDTTVDAQFALQAARRKVNVALMVARNDGTNHDELRHLMVLDSMLQSLQFTANDAVNAARAAFYLWTYGAIPQESKRREG